jgi:hypothetical protein
VSANPFLQRQFNRAEAHRTQGENVLARILFFLTAASATITAAVLAGLLTAVIGMSAHLPAATLITLIAGAVTAAGGAAIALTSMAASLFFSPPTPHSPSPPTKPHSSVHHEAQDS